MEDVYTIKVKTKPDTRNLYPSERRYSASTVSGLAWVHIALAATSFLLACLALVNPNSDISRLNLNDTVQTAVSSDKNLLNFTELDNATATDSEDNNYYANNYILFVAPGLLTVFALGAGIASILASVRWYIDRNITWLLIMSILSTAVSFIAFSMVAIWFVSTSDGNGISEFYTDKVPFRDYFLVQHKDIVYKNDSHIVVARNSTDNIQESTHLFTKSVLSINILIAAFLELLWSILSVKISYKGMKKNYKDDENQRPNCISVVTTIKGNDMKNVNRKSAKPDLIEHYPNNKIKKVFLAQSDNGFYLKNQRNKNKQTTETSSEFYKERMMSFLNRCASSEANSNPERSPSVQSDTALNSIPEGVVTQTNAQESSYLTPKDRMTPISWGDSPDHTIYNQNNLNFEKIFAFGGKKQKTIDKNVAKENSVEPNIDISENVQNN